MIISAAAAISGILLGWLGHSRTVRQDIWQDGTQEGELKATINYIRQGIDEVKVELKARGQRYDMLAERVTRVEESAKQAHKRIDRLEGQLKGEGK